MPASTLQINVVKTYSLFVSTTLYQWGKTHTKGMGIGGPVTPNRNIYLYKEKMATEIPLYSEPKEITEA